MASSSPSKLAPVCQTQFAFIPQVLPRGDGSFIVTPGKPQEWLWLKDAAKLCGMTNCGVRKWAPRPGSGLVMRRMGQRRFQILAESLLKSQRPWNFLE